MAEYEERRDGKTWLSGLTKLVQFAFYLRTHHQQQYLTATRSTISGISSLHHIYQAARATVARNELQYQAACTLCIDRQRPQSIPRVDHLDSSIPMHIKITAIFD